MIFSQTRVSRLRTVCDDAKKTTVATAIPQEHFEKDRYAESIQVDSIRPT
jgi:hypothetical protein